MLAGGSSRVMLASAGLSCFCCHLLNLAIKLPRPKGYPYMSYPDVNMNYVKNPLLLDISVEIAKVS